MKRIATVSIACFMILGCRSFYQETGTSITTGDVSAPLEVSDASDILTVRALFAMTGMRIWASRGASVNMEYRHEYTNSYFFGLVENRGVQDSYAEVRSGDVETDCNSKGGAGND